MPDGLGNGAQAAPGGPVEPTLWDHLEKYPRHLNTQECTPATLHHKKKEIGLFLRFLAGTGHSMMAGEVTDEHILLHCQWRREDGPLGRRTRDMSAEGEIVRRCVEKALSTDETGRQLVRRHMPAGTSGARWQKGFVTVIISRHAYKGASLYGTAHYVSAEAGKRVPVKPGNPGAGTPLQHLASETNTTVAD